MTVGQTFHPWKGVSQVSRFDALILNSGGMDSTTAVADTLQRYDSDRVVTISFDYGQRHKNMELGAAELVAAHFGLQHLVIDLSPLTPLLSGSALTDPTIPVPDGHYEAETMKITVVPNRNSIMLSIAFGIARAAGATEVVAGMHAGDHAIYPDCRASFAEAFNEAMLLANDDITEPPMLVTPFISMTKAEIVDLGTALQVPYELTYSCYKGEKLHCGTCGTCTERREAFQLAGVTDPTLYSVGQQSN